ncbi:Deoxyribonucleoside regulator [Austwickia sp. TVS 96-490-7B]|uniref:sugar-binding transcriptional regulator n=1 Tax=Austwickia sp. TVS 96-490-7B TaxID=2830843 RepID=UPI001C582963|nr:sugar-binding transcriptional regulator [Austwickia sp. TVS 96-490-7B]MBW3086128.1 Deoxyribonucleoside regulator [Austwickia sp. TVS 96-490-7B]
MHESDRVYEAAALYYLQDETMESIGSRLQVSRSTVSRMLKQARDSGIVRISVAPAEALTSPLAERLRSAFTVSAHVVPVRDSANIATRLDAVARQAAALLGDLITDETIVGVAWGTTMSAVSSHLPSAATRGSEVVQLNGAANMTTSGVAYASEILARFGRAFDAHVHNFPVPAFFDYPDTKAALWRERSVRRVLDRQARMDIAVFGVGTFAGPMPSHVYSSGYLSSEDIAELLRQGAVGDICTVALREDGTYADIPLNQRASGPTPAMLAQVPRRVCVVAGQHRAQATLGALRSGAVTDLIIDEQTARSLLDRATPRSRPAGTH